MKYRLLGSVVLASLFSMAASAEEFRGQGVYSFAGSSACPFSVSSDANACRRVALADGETGASVVAEKHQILLSNAKAYPGKTLVADVFLPATAKNAAGQLVPLVLHAKISKSGNRPMTISTHGHAPVSGPFHDVNMEPWQIIGDAGQKGESVLLSASAAMSTLANPSLAARVAHEFVEVQDNRPHAGGNHPDITIKIGLGKLATSVMRSRLVAADSRGVEKLQQTLQSGNWSLELTSLSNSIPLAVARHEIFLYGLDQQPLLKTMYRDGFRKGSHLVIGAKDGAGYLSVGGETAPFPEAAQSAQQYMNVSFIGLILAWQQLNPN